MIILAFYYYSLENQHWLNRVVEYLDSHLKGSDIISLFMPSKQCLQGTMKAECIYPRFVFEHEEKELADLNEIIAQLEERMRMSQLPEPSNLRPDQLQ
jgi:hypothetical protein